jgi:hypothetical protein
MERHGRRESRCIARLIWVLVSKIHGVIPAQAGIQFRAVDDDAKKN